MLTYPMSRGTTVKVMRYYSSPIKMAQIPRYRQHPSADKDVEQHELSLIAAAIVSEVGQSTSRVLGIL